MIHYFNPGHETAVLNSSPYYMPPANVLNMQYELAFLPAWYGSAGDYVLVGDNVKAVALSLKEILPDLPCPIIEKDLVNVPHERVCLWGVSPQAVHFFSELNRQYEIQLEIPVWRDEYKLLNSREMAKECLLKLVNSHAEISGDIVPVFCKTLDEAEEFLRLTDRPLLAKSPYSSSGRGLIWLSSRDLSVKEKELLHGVFKKQSSISIEPALEKDTDFAMQFLCDEKGGVSFEGYSLFETNKKGAYIGNQLLAQEEIGALIAEKIRSSLLEEIKNDLILFLKEKYAGIYTGCVGIDMMIYTENGNYKLHPCIEINMRYNMGYLSIRLQQNYIHKLSTGKFRLEFNKRESETYNKHKELEKKFPLSMCEGKIQKGYLSLCPVFPQSKYHAYILIEEMLNAESAFLEEAGF